MSERERGFILDPVVQKFLEDLVHKGGEPLYRLPVAQARQVLVDLQKAYKADGPAADITELDIQHGSKSAHVYIVRPQGITNVLPAIVYLHGGGWVLGDFSTHERLVRELAHRTGAAVVFVDYTRAPEATYPTIHEQAYAVAEWVAKNGQQIGLDSSKMAIAGDSVGGLMATAVALMAKKRGGPKFVYQALFYPVTDAGMNTPSYHTFQKGYFLEKEGMRWFWDAYVPEKSIRTDPLVAPLNALLEDLQGLPPALVMVGECDVLRDEGEAYAQNLMNAGVPVVLERYPGLIHDFLMLNALAGSKEVQAALELAAHMLKHNF